MSDAMAFSVEDLENKFKTWSPIIKSDPLWYKQVMPFLLDLGKKVYIIKLTIL